MSESLQKKQFADVIDPRTCSTRIFFAKENEMAGVWHMCDAALGSHSTGTGLQFMALHGKWIATPVRVDTVLQVDLRRKSHEQLCERCLEEFMLAVDLIKDRRLLKFE